MLILCHTLQINLNSFLKLIEAMSFYSLFIVIFFIHTFCWCTKNYCLKEEAKIVATSLAWSKKAAIFCYSRNYISLLFCFCARYVWRSFCFGLLLLNFVLFWWAVFLYLLQVIFSDFATITRRIFLSINWRCCGTAKIVPQFYCIFVFSK